jgi:glucose/arabinose dehydrogenase
VGQFIGALCLLALILSTGCALGPHVLPAADQTTIDRKITEYPTRFVLQPYAVGLDSPTGMSFDESGNLIVAESGVDGDPHIFGFRPDGTKFNIYPIHSRIPLIHPGYHIYGPVGGVLAYKGHVYVSHRDDHNMGVITAFGYDGSYRTVVADLPAQGDYGVTDIAVSPVDGILYFGVGAATNSGVVGLDNWEEGWSRKYPNAADVPYQALELLGYRFDAKNPDASIFSPGIKVTVPFEPFGVSNITHIPGAKSNFPVVKPSGAIFRISPDGGDISVVAWGVRNPSGIVVNQFNTVYFTDQGMERRGTRPVKDDPDGLFRLIPQTWYGFPDYSRSLEPISDPKYQPEQWMVDPSGYPNVRFVIDHQASDLHEPDRRRISGLFKPLSGASKMAVVPGTGPFHGTAFEGSIIVALWGDRAPFATHDLPLKKPLPGYKLVRVDPATGEVHDFIYNTAGGPASELRDGSGEALERPIDVKFGPDGALYILDFGRSRMKHSKEKVTDGTGKIFRMVPVGFTASTQPVR